LGQFIFSTTLTVLEATIHEGVVRYPSAAVSTEQTVEPAALHKGIHDGEK
jgi:hypothetical protein